MQINGTLIIPSSGTFPENRISGEQFGEKIGHFWYHFKDRVVYLVNSDANHRIRILGLTF